MYRLTQEQLAHTIFPLGYLSKNEVRKIAEDNGFLNAHKPDSQDICFVPDGDYTKVIERFSGKQITTGDFVDTNGNVIGKHKGIIHYTVGQRKGLGISSQNPLYVCKINPHTLDIMLGHREDLYQNKMIVKKVNWVSGVSENQIKCSVKIRYRGPELPCAVYLDNDIASVIFDTPACAITPGQSAVFYNNDIILGGGIIE